MVSICSAIGSVWGFVSFEENRATSKLLESTARVRQHATLDRGSVNVHQGFTVGDMVFIVRADVSEAQADILRRLLEGEQDVTISHSGGCYRGAISKIIIDTGALTCWILVEERLTA